MNSRAENKRGDKPTYTKIKVQINRGDFILWAVTQLTEWSKTKPLAEASLDRKDNAGHYELSNLQLLSLHDNSKKRSNTVLSSGSPKGHRWCRVCKDHLPSINFHTDIKRKSGEVNERTICKFHHAQDKQQRKLKKHLDNIDNIC